jgi:hypothetical protein
MPGSGRTLTGLYTNKGERQRDFGRITGNSDRIAATFTQSLIGGMEAIGHEAKTALTKKTHQHKFKRTQADVSKNRSLT